MKHSQIFIFIVFFIFIFFNQATISANNLSTVKDIRVNVENNKVRLVADINREVDYNTFALINPNRIIIDLHGATLSKECKREFILNNRYIKRVKIGQFNPKTVRIVVDSPLKKDGYDVFSLSNKSSYRVVMDFGKLQNKNISLNKDYIPTLTIPTTSSTSSSNSSSSSVSKNESKDNFSPGIKGKIIAIDPGHGGNDSGALGPNGGMEKISALGISLKLKKLLENAGAKVVMTRTTDTSVASPNASDVEELQARCDVANNANADIFISIHNDSFTSPSANGTSTYYYHSNNPLGKILANCVRQSLVEEIKTLDRGTRSCNFYVVKHTDMPAILVEAAFISNPDDEKILMSSQGQEKVAQGIFNGIKNFFNKEY